jgi:hypothetical protein
MTNTNSMTSRPTRRPPGIPHTIALLLLLCAANASAQDDPFARRAWNLQLAGHGALEAWNYNISREEMWGIVPGFTYGVGRGVAVTAAWPMYYVAQRGPNVWMFGATIGVRGRFYRRGRVAAFWELDVGVSKAETHTPPRGTRFNYLAFGGAGATVRLRPGTHMLAGLRWIHVSNNGLAGRDRNPDIEAIGPQMGILISF